MAENKTYFALTIGPIYKTIGKGEKTREIWAASYLFSYLCRELLQTLISNGLLLEDDILLPSPKALKRDVKPGVGLFPDRILATFDKKNFEEVQKTIKSVKKKLADNIQEGIQKYDGYDPYAFHFGEELSQPHLVGAVSAFLEDYFQVYSLEISDKDLGLANDKNEPLGIVKCLNLYLDHLELRSGLSSYDPDPVKIFLRAVNHSFLLEDAFHKDVKKFDSLIEIATTELRFIRGKDAWLFRGAYDTIVKEKVEEAILKERKEARSDKLIPKDYDDLLDQLFAIEGSFDYLRTYHRYVAIVHADGDNMGKLIGPMSETEIKDFSADLLKFADEANKIIAGQKYTHASPDDWGYGGAPVYIGGDDLVFFAPVASRDKGGKFQTIFHLIAKIDKCFTDIFNALKKDENGKVLEGQYAKYKNAQKRPCMSYGISISYVKHPLKEAYQRSLKLMEHVKNDKDNKQFESRNRLHFEVLKHSGQTYGGVIDKNHAKSFTTFLDLLEDKQRTIEGKEAEQFVNSLTQALRRDAATVKAVARSPEQLEAYFTNTFNEPVHKSHADYLNEVRKLLTDMFATYGTGDFAISPDEVLSTFNGLLRFIHFIRDNEFR